MQTVDEMMIAEQAVDEFFVLLSVLLADKNNKEHAIQSHLFAVVNFVLKQSKHARLGSLALQAIQDMTNHNSPDAKFTRALCKQVLFDFDLWQRSEYAVRMSHLQVVKGFAHQHPLFFRRTYGVQFVLDHLREVSRQSISRRSTREDLLSSESPNVSGQAARESKRRAAPTSFSRDSGDEELRSIHRLMMEIVFFCIRTDITRRECRAIYTFLLSCEDGLFACRGGGVVCLPVCLSVCLSVSPSFPCHSS